MENAKRAAPRINVYSAAEIQTVSANKKGLEEHAMPRTSVVSIIISYLYHLYHIFPSRCTVCVQGVQLPLGKP